VFVIHLPPERSRRWTYNDPKRNVRNHLPLAPPSREGDKKTLSPGGRGQGEGDSRTEASALFWRLPSPLPKNQKQARDR